MIFNLLDSIFVKRTSSKPVSTKKEVMICTEFLGKVSIQMKKKLQQIFRECGKGIRLRIVFKSPNRLRTGFSFKDPVPIDMDSFLLYKYTCDTCNCVYIGETTRHYLVRTSEHLRISILTGDGLSYNEKSATAVAQHSHIHNHPSGIENFQIMGHASSRYHSLLKEALLIQVVKPTIENINKQKFSIPLHLFGNWLSGNGNWWFWTNSKIRMLLFCWNLMYWLVVLFFHLGWLMWGVPHERSCKQHDFTNTLVACLFVTFFQKVF